MTRDQLQGYQKKFHKKQKQLLNAKNHDYTGGSEDPFYNFRLVETLGIQPTELGILTRMSDKFARLINLVKGTEQLVMNESLEDTLLDLSNYCVVLGAYLETKNDNNNKANEHLSYTIVPGGATSIGPGA